MSEAAPPGSEGRVLVIDDEPSLRDVLKLGLSRAGFEVGTAATHAEGIAQLAEPWDLVLTDLQLPDGDGLSILRYAKEVSPETAVVVLTAHGSADTAVAAMKLGAHDYLTKPFDLDELRIRVRQAIEGEKLRRENRELRAQVGARAGIQGLVGKSAAMRAVVARVRAVASSSSTVLIVGESGTGKELVARAIHDLSPRKNRPFVAINCGAIAESLLESEMFGHVKGAFTDARQARAGVIEQANQGTLLLDEIGEMPLSMQVKLLRVIQERRVRRVGGADETPVDVRIIAATHRDLMQMVREGTFREDLYYRIDVIQVPIPPLRDRREDIPSARGRVLDASLPSRRGAEEGLLTRGDVRLHATLLARQRARARERRGAIAHPGVGRECRSRGPLARVELPRRVHSGSARRLFHAGLPEAHREPPRSARHGDLGWPKA